MLPQYLSAAQIRRTISLASLDALLNIAQDDLERERFLLSMRETGKNMLWRDERETKKMPNDAERALVLAARRGLSESRFMVERAKRWWNWEDEQLADASCGRGQDRSYWLIRSERGSTSYYCSCGRAARGEPSSWNSRSMVTQAERCRYTQETKVGLVAACHLGQRALPIRSDDR